MMVVATAADMRAHVGRDLGTSERLTIDQPMIEAVAAATGDHQWIHVDVERARKELPGGRTIAHGYLLLSLLPRLAPQIWRIEKRSRGLNYGNNKVRFTNSVPAGARVRLRQKVAAVEESGGGWRIVMDSTLELEGQERPAMIAQTISLVFD
jgi:acyl dehydratase